MKLSALASLFGAPLLALAHADSTSSTHSDKSATRSASPSPSSQPPACGNAFERLNKSDAALLIVDYQVGLFHQVHDWDPTLFRNNMMAHAALGSLFNLPVVITTTGEQGPNGPVPKELRQRYPNAPYIERRGEVDAWDNAAFRAAVEATGKRQLIIAGLTLDSEVTLLALSLRASGYSVFANVEASGTESKLIRDVSNDRMRAAGVHLASLYTIVTDLMRNWEDTPGAADVVPFLDRYYPAFGFKARAHAAAVVNGTIGPGEQELLY